MGENCGYTRNAAGHNDLHIYGDCCKGLECGGIPFGAAGGVSVCVKPGTISKKYWGGRYGKRTLSKYVQPKHSMQFILSLEL